MQPDWRQVQTQLKKMGHYLGAIDGIPGAVTKRAVKAFQKVAGLVEDGVVGRMTRSALAQFEPLLDHSITTAAELADLSYKVKKKGLSSVNKTLKEKFNIQIESQCPVKGVEAYMLSNRCLLVPGSNSVWDYAKFNFRLLNIGVPRLRFKSGEKGKTTTDSDGNIWHQGFFAHANHIGTWIGPNKANWPKLIIGHSLGAASAQFLSTIWLAPSIGFAAPRILKSSQSAQFRNLSLSICRKDDVVCRLPSGFDRIGSSRTLIHKSRKFGMNHKMSAYIDALENQASGLDIPDVWRPQG
ncbi:peptidoglycan-binding protein [Shimia sp.]|uniref:peptidoglycan-binding protein n=1 Tax=Shimia sp. TaxID=1954381 RepID=UPI003299E083